MCNSDNRFEVRQNLATLKRVLSISVATSVLLFGSTALAQDADNTETVVVTGYRASLEKSLDLKRSTNEMIDAISAEDVGKFPDSNLAESLQRLPGVAVDRDNGEGRTITVRGLGSNFTRVTLNGLQALSTAGASDSGTAPNRDRGFDFNIFASELFSRLKVQKSASAATEDGSLGATVALSTPNALDYGDKYFISVQNAWYEMGKPFNPRISALASHTFLGGKLGAVLSGAFTIRNQYIDAYLRGPGAGDLTYRGSKFTPAAYTGLPAGSTSTSGFPQGSTTFLGRNGFAAPTGSSCNGLTAPYSQGVIPGNNITYAPYCSALSGSDPAAYALINSPQGWGTTATVTQKGSKTAVSTQTTGPGSTVLIPSLPTLNHQQLYQQRIGLTAGMQYQPDDDTTLSFDGLFSTAYQDSTNYQLQVVGLNRNYTNANLNTGTVTASMFTQCTPQTGSATLADVQCGGKKNLDTYSYYTSPTYGYDTAGNAAKAAAISFVGRPATKLMAGSSVMSNGLAANKLVLDNVDFRSAADQAYYTTQFEQLSLNGTHNFSSRLRADFTVGWSHSNNHQTGLLAEVNHMDNTYASTGQYFVWDDTTGGDMPSMNFGFDVANPSNWTMVKGFSALRHYEYYTDNKYRTLMTNFTYDISDWLSIDAGFNMRIFDFGTSYYARAIKDAVNPSFQEAGVTTAQMTQVVNWGAGLDVPSGMPTSFVVPNLNAFKATYGFNCNCINDYGDWRVWNKFNPTGNPSGQTYTVSEHSKAYYLQADFHEVPLFGNTLRGNAGLRFVTTEVQALGHAMQGQEITAHNSYNDFLPSINLAYSLSDDMLIRAAASKVIARPSLQYLSPSITALSFPSSNQGTNYTGMTMATGNPYLKPYRAKTADFGWEWYFDKGAIFAVTGFVKWVSDNPQVVVSSGYVKDFLTPAQIATIRNYYASLTSSATNNYNMAYLDNNGTVANTEAQNGKGGVLEGIEATFTRNLDFIPAVFGGKGFGVNANYTKIYSKQHYIVNATAAVTTYGDAPWNGASPDSWNFTLFYDGPNWSARVSSAFRSSYLYIYPIAGGSDVVGYGDSPLLQDFGYSRNTLNVDFSGSYEINDNMEATINALNLTNQSDRRWAYQNSPQTTRYSATGRQVFLGFRLKY